MKNNLLVIVLFSFILGSCKQTTLLVDLPSSFVMYESEKVHFKTAGKGDKTLVFIHGWGCDLNVWQNQLDYFSSKARLVFIDLPGFGLSSKSDIEYSQDLFAAAIYEVLIELKITHPIFVGHSLGHPVCRQVIKNYPDLNPRMCIVDGVYFKIPRDSFQRIEYLGQLNGFTGLFLGNQRDQNIEDFINSLFIDSTPQLVFDYTDSTMKMTDEHVGYNTMKNLVLEEVWIEEPVLVPTLAVYANIPELPDDNEIYLSQLYPDLEYQEINDSGHFIMLEKPNKFNQVLDRFIRK